MNSSRPLLLVSAAASIVFLLAGLYTSAGWPVIFKVASILPLALLGFRFNKLLGAALTLGTVGDFLLGVPRLGSLNSERLFLLGLGAFLLGHLVYIGMFSKFRPPTWWKQNAARELGVIVVLVTLGLMLAVLQHELGPLLIPVAIYALVLAAMATSALLADLGTPLAAIGALSFVTSDAMLAVSKFRAPFPESTALVWITYYLAQLFIFLGVAYRHVRPAVHL